MSNISARIEAGDPLPGESTPQHFAVVDLDFVPGVPDKVVSVQVQRSLLHGDTILVEIDGDLSEGFPSMRIVMNDGLIYDTNFPHGGYGVQLTDQRDDVRGCSCGQADYGTPGHDGAPNGHGGGVELTRRFPKPAAALVLNSYLEDRQSTLDDWHVLVTAFGREAAGELLYAAYRRDQARYEDIDFDVLVKLHLD